MVAVIAPTVTIVRAELSGLTTMSTALPLAASIVLANQSSQRMVCVDSARRTRSEGASLCVREGVGNKDFFAGLTSGNRIRYAQQSVPIDSPPVIARSRFHDCSSETSLQFFIVPLKCFHLGLKRGDPILDHLSQRRLQIWRSEASAIAELTPDISLALYTALQPIVYPQLPAIALGPRMMK